MHSDKIKLKRITQNFPAVCLNEQSCRLNSLTCQPGFQDKRPCWCFCCGGMKHVLNQLLGEVAKVHVEAFVTTIQMIEFCLEKGMLITN